MNPMFHHVMKINPFISQCPSCMARSNGELLLPRYSRCFGPCSQRGFLRVILHRYQWCLPLRWYLINMIGWSYRLILWCLMLYAWLMVCSSFKLWLNRLNSQSWREKSRETFELFGHNQWSSRKSWFSQSTNETWNHQLARFVTPDRYTTAEWFIKG